MTVADLQSYLTNLADAVAASTRSDLAARDLRAAVDSLGPFAALELADLARLLVDAQEYARTGKVAVPPGKKRREKRPAEELPGAIESLRGRAAAEAAGVRVRPGAPRSAVVEALVKLVMDARPSAGPLPPAEGSPPG